MDGPTGTTLAAPWPADCCKGTTRLKTCNTHCGTHDRPFSAEMLDGMVPLRLFKSRVSTLATYRTQHKQTNR